MAQRFVTAQELLNHLLDRHEAGVERPFAYPDHAAFPSVVAADLFARELAEAEQRGGVFITRGRGARREEIGHVRLGAPDVLYSHVGRTPMSRLAEQAHARLVDGLALDSRLLDAASRIADIWLRARTWNGL